jgi:hypothetical protein
MHDGPDMGVERLTRLLLECARADRALPRRPPANDNLPLGGFDDDMYNRLEALRGEPLSDLSPQELSSDVLALAPHLPQHQGSLEELVAVALGAAQQADDLARDASEIGRRNRYGIALAVAVAVVGMVVTTAGTISARLGHRGDTVQTAEIARQAQALNDLQRRVNDQLTQMQARTPVQEATATQAAPGVAPMSPNGTQMGTQMGTQVGIQIATAPPMLEPLKAVPVRVLPAEATPPQDEPPPPQDMDDSRTYAPSRPRVRHYRVVAPRPAAYVIGSPAPFVWGMYR